MSDSNDINPIDELGFKLICAAIVMIVLAGLGLWCYRKPEGTALERLERIEQIQKQNLELMRKLVKEPE